jgi:polyisoprenoid-binding protein YceI
MPRRLRRLLIAAAALTVLALAGGLVAFLAIGGDAPPPPRLSQPQAAATAAPAGGAWGVDRARSFVGYRVREKYAGIGVKDAVGRTGQVSGTVRMGGGRVRAADLTTAMGSLRSDQSRRDDTLRFKAIETDRYPTSRFVLEGPFAVSRRAQAVHGRLTLHGHTAPITARVRGQRVRGTIELAGSAPVEFAPFAIVPPSIAGFVTVQDHGMLEFKLTLQPSG